MIRLAVVLVSVFVLTTGVSGGAASSDPPRLSYAIGVTDGRHPEYGAALGGGLCLADANGGQGRRLTSPKAHDDSPTWSPDGRLVAFHRSQPGNRHGIYVQDESGRSHVVVEVSATGSFYRSVGSPSWSPDGQRIVFVHWSACVHGCFPLSGLTSIRPDGTDQRSLAGELFVNDSHPSWSPSGDTIAFESYDLRGEEPQGIYLADADGTNRRLLVRDGSRPSWSPDGRSIVLSRRMGGLNYSDLVIVNADGSAQRPLTHELGEEENPAWSPDGQWIAFEKRAHCSVTCGGGIDGTDIEVIRPDGTDEHVVRGSTLAELTPAWRPSASAPPGPRKSMRDLGHPPARDDPRDVAGRPDLRGPRLGPRLRAGRRRPDHRRPWPRPGLRWAW